MVDNTVKGKISPGPGQMEKDAELVEITQANEHWSQWSLVDGSVLKMKPVVIEIWKLVDEFDAEGNPVYVVKASNVMHQSVPDNLKKRQ